MKKRFIPVFLLSLLLLITSIQVNTITSSATEHTNDSTTVYNSSDFQKESMYLLSITCVNNHIKKYALSENELSNFIEWFGNSSCQETYHFAKTLNSVSYDEYLVSDKIVSYNFDKLDTNSFDLNDTDDDNNVLLQSNKKLSITLLSGRTQSYDVDDAEAAKFVDWFNSNNGNGQVKYAFSKDKNNDMLKDYIVFDKIVSFRINN